VGSKAHPRRDPRDKLINRHWPKSMSLLGRLQRGHASSSQLERASHHCNPRSVLTGLMPVSPDKSFCSEPHVKFFSEPLLVLGCLLCGVKISPTLRAAGHGCLPRSLSQGLSRGPCPSNCFAGFIVHLTHSFQVAPFRLRICVGYPEHPHAPVLPKAVSMGRHRLPGGKCRQPSSWERAR